MDTVLIVLIGVPFIIFMIFVAPLWLILHFRGKSKAQKGVSEQDQQAIRETHQQIEQMAARIATLESILDIDNPDWRSKL